MVYKFIANREATHALYSTPISATCPTTVFMFGTSTLQALERIAGLLEGPSASLTVAERGDVTAIPRHASFRLLAAMNPATDAGKRDLPAPLRNRLGSNAIHVQSSTCCP